MSDFPRPITKEKHFFYKLLSRKYDVRITSRPDIVIYTPFGDEYRAYDCLRVCYIQENWRPNFAECDYAFCFDYDSHGGKCFRLPYYAYAVRNDVDSLIRDPEQEVRPEHALNRGFCSFVATNSKGRKRNAFAERLNRYKRVDYGGKYRNNVGGPVKDKRSFLSAYKFNIAFENSSYPGYTTEKIVEAFQAGTVPIYWGNPRIVEEFNPRSFINCHEFKSMRDVVRRVAEIDQNDELYLEYLGQPCFHGNTPNRYFDQSIYLSRLDHIISQVGKQKPVCRRFRRFFGFRKQRRKMDFLRNRLSNYLR
jgi:hypothetical protein